MNLTMRTTSRRAFTLIELMVVIVIIGLLVSILAPSISRAIQSSYATRTRSTIQNLERGLEAFKSDNRFYPGQTDKTGKKHVHYSTQGGYSTMHLKGSEFLLRSLWTEADPELTTFNANWATTVLKTTKYATYDAAIRITDHKTTAYNNTISDGFGKQKEMPILYFVANPSYDNKDQFKNSNGAVPPTAAGSHWYVADMNNNYTGNVRLPNGVIDKLWSRVKDRYILIAPGLDRKYFTDDDITN